MVEPIDGDFQHVEGALAAHLLRRDEAPQRLQRLAHDGDRRLEGVGVVLRRKADALGRSAEHTSELQSLMRISYAVFCLKQKNQQYTHHNTCTHRNTYKI